MEMIYFGDAIQIFKLTNTINIYPTPIMIIQFT